MSAGRLKTTDELFPEVLRRLEARIDALENDVAALNETNRSLRGLHASYCRAEIRRYLADKAARSPLRSRGRDAEKQPFDIDVILTGGLDPGSLTRPDLVFDQKSLEAKYVGIHRLLGAIKENEALDFLRRACLRLLQRLARRAAAQLGMSAELLQDAWFYSIEMEIWQLIPARHMARALARICGQDPVILSVPSLTFNYLAHGAETHGVELFYLIYELKRLGVPVALACDSAELLEQARTRGTVQMRLQPYHDLWVVKEPMESVPAEPASERTALVGAGIRGIKQILKLCPDPLRIQSGYVMDPAFGAAEQTIIDPHRAPVAINVPFLSGLPSESSGEAMVLSATLPHADAGSYMITALGGATEAAFERAREVVKRHRLSEVHMCASPFFESALIAHAVKEQGGKVALWPHSFNIGDIGKLRRPGTVDAIYVPWGPDATRCKALFPDIPITVIPDFWLPQCHPSPEPVDGEPLTIVLISNDPIAHRLALADVGIIEKTFRDLFAAIDAMPDADYLCRPRSQNTLQWLWELSGRRPDFPYTASYPLIIDHPNMVFLFINQLSSALMEGIVRGIPALYLRDDERARDYLQIGDPDCLPTGDFATILDEIGKCRDPKYRRALADAQQAWYKDMTSQPA